MFRQTDDLRVLDVEWQLKDDEAKRTTFSLDEWDQRSINRWDLDEDHRKPTGERNPDTYRYDKPLRRQNSSPGKNRVRDLRENPRIRDKRTKERDW